MAEFALTKSVTSRVVICEKRLKRIDLATYVTKVDLPFLEHILKELQS